MKIIIIKVKLINYVRADRKYQRKLEGLVISGWRAVDDVMGKLALELGLKE